MDVLIITATGTLASFALIVFWFLKKISTPKKKLFPTCRYCGRYMGRQIFSKEEMPYEIKAYLEKWNLPEMIIRKHICPSYHSELWIAPPVSDMEKSLFVSRRI